MVPDLSDTAWTLLVMLDQERQGGHKTPTTADFAAAYSELVEQGFVQARTITRKGSSAVSSHLLNRGGSDRGSRRPVQ